MSSDWWKLRYKIDGKIHENEEIQQILQYVVKLNCEKNIHIQNNVQLNSKILVSCKIT